MSAPTTVRDVIEDYVDDLHSRLSTNDFEGVLNGERDDLTSRVLGSKPETHVQSELIYPLLNALDLEHTEEPYGSGGGTDDERDIVWPDFELDTTSEYVIGENKAPNCVDDSRSQILDYLDRRSIGADYAIATDGFTWRLYKVEQVGDRTEFPIISEISLRDAICEIAREKNYIATLGTSVEVSDELAEFTELFAYDEFEQFITQTAPQRLRDDRHQDVKEFYELYIEYLFGESSEHDETTCLMDDVVPPSDDTTEHEQRKFAITLMNRLLFIKFLEKKEVVPEGILIDRVRVYEENKAGFTGNLYDTQIKPLFYDLFNRPKDNRESKHRSGWFTRVPYLNGGLFRPNVEDEEDYRLEDRTLPDIIREVIEGERLSDPEEALDPAILGSVFEMTINHIGGEFGSQKDIGAYYTPGDVTDKIVEQTVDPKAREVLLDAYSKDYGEEIRGRMEELSLAEILQRIEDGEGWFGDSDATQRAYNQLGELRVVDPACGSGHFLTTVMEEIHRLRRSLLRGLNRGEAPDAEKDYQSKRHLALNCIYGVDVDPIGVEIARLRVWLKIVEDEWREEFGRLPNIELNIVAGNSLVGLPVEQEGQIQADVWTDRLDDLVALREEYKDENRGTEKEDVMGTLREVRENLNDEYLKRLSHVGETEVTTPEAWYGIVDGLDDGPLYPQLQTVQLRRSDGEEFSQNEIDRLDEMGFRTYTYSARLDFQSRAEELNPERATRSQADINEQILEELTELIEDNYVFAEVERQPLSYDLDQILGRPFHWMAEFPEVATENGNGTGHTLDFDIVLGNPPYGDLLNESGQLLVGEYATSSIRDVSAYFVERQIRLLDDDGAFGNITTLRLVYQSSLQPLHDFIRSRFPLTRISCFAHRPQQVFPNAIVRVAILTAQRSSAQNNGTGEIHTSKFLQFDTDNRQDVFDDISYRPVEGLELRERIGGDDRSYEVLPKIGTEELDSILTKLQDRSDRIIDDAAVDDETDYPVYRRRGGGYWLNAVPENIHGSATTIEPIYFENELERQMAFLTINSSLFYVYWMAYADFRHLNTGHITRFPLPDHDTLTEYEDRIIGLANDMWETMQEVHSGGNRDQFNMPAVKPIIDLADELLADIYDLSDHEVEYVQNYNNEYGRHGPENDTEALTTDET